LIQFPDQLYSLKVYPGANLIEVVIDNLDNKYGSVSIETCENISRELSRELDTSFGDVDFAISVSSVGAERILQLPGDLKRFEGLDAKLEYKTPEGKNVTDIFRINSVSEKISLGKYGKGNSRKKIVEEIILNINDIIKGNLYLKV